jgi:hypothetical protein
MATWKASAGQTLFDLALQLYGNVSFAYKILADNGLDWNYQSSTGDEITYDPSGTDLGIQRTLLTNRVVISTGFQTEGGNPPIIQRSYNNDFSLDFD